jgi:hypothetical protein
MLICVFYFLLFASALEHTGIHQQKSHSGHLVISQLTGIILWKAYLKSN